MNNFSSVFLQLLKNQLILLNIRIVAKGYYSEQDASECVKQLCEAVGVCMCGL